jgi:hypothetical protein
MRGRPVSRIERHDDGRILVVLVCRHEFYASPQVAAQAQANGWAICLSCRAPLPELPRAPRRPS